MIERVVYSGWKNLDSREFEPGPMTAIVGDNASGKTARLVGIQAAITGKVPTGDRPEAVARYIAGREGAVDIQFVGGFRFRRSWSRTAAGGVRQRIEFPFGEPATLGNAQTVIREEVGDFAPAFDLTAFLKNDAESRRSTVLDLCARHSPNSVHNAKELGDRVAFYIVREREGRVAFDGFVRGRFQKEVSQLTAAERAAVVSESGFESSVLAGMVDGLDAMPQFELTAALSNMIGAAKNVTRRSKAEMDEAVQVVRKLAEDAPDIGAGNAEDLRNERDEARARVTELSEQIGRVEEAERGIKIQSDELKSVNSAISKARGQIETLKASPPRDPAVLEEEAAQIEKAVDSSATLESLTASEERIDAHRDAIARAKAELIGKEQAIKEADADPWRAVQKLLSTLRDPGYGLVEFIHGMDPLLVRTWEDLVKIVDENAKEAPKRDLTEYRSHVSRLEAELEVFEGERSQAREKIERNQSELQRAAQLKADANQAKFEKEQHTQTVNGLQVGLDDLETKARSIQTTIQRYRETVGGANKADLETQKKSLRDRVGTLNEQIEAVVRRDALAEEQARARQQSTELEARHNDAKEIGKAIKAVRDEVLNDTVRPLVDRIREVTGVPAYLDLETPSGRAAFDIGWITSSRKISLDTLSGGEASLFGAGLAFALMDMAAPPMRILMIEAGNLDSTMFQKLVDGLGRVKDRITQAILATHVNIGKENDLPGWSLVVTG